MTLQAVVINSSVLTQIKQNTIKTNCLLGGFTIASKVHIVCQGTLLSMFWFINYKKGSLRIIETSKFSSMRKIMCTQKRSYILDVQAPKEGLEVYEEPLFTQSAILEKSQQTLNFLYMCITRGKLFCRRIGKFGPSIDPNLQTDMKSPLAAEMIFLGDHRLVSSFLFNHRSSLKLSHSAKK